MHKPELEAELSGKGAYVQIDILNRFLRLMPPHEMRKFAWEKLAKVYMEQRMFRDASQAYQSIAVNSTTFREKSGNYILCAKALIEGGFFEDAERALKRALGEANIEQKKEVMKEIKNFYKELGNDLVMKDKRNKATIYYEKFLKQNEVAEDERVAVKEKLKVIYESLGKVSEIKWLDGI